MNIRAIPGRSPDAFDIAGRRRADFEKLSVLNGAIPGEGLFPLRALLVLCVNYLPQVGDTGISKKLKLLTRAYRGGADSASSPSP